MKFKLRSTNFESICREFARKMYVKLAYTDLDFLFSPRGYMRMSFAADPALLEVFYDIALPSLQHQGGKDKRLDRPAFDKLCDKYDVVRGTGLTNTAIEIIDYYLETFHENALEELYKKYSKGEVLTEAQKRLMEPYATILHKPMPATETPVQEPQSAGEAMLIDTAYKAFLKAEDIMWINELLSKDNIRLSNEIGQMYRIEGINCYHRSAKNDPIREFQVRKGEVVGLVTRAGQFIEIPQPVGK